MTADQPPRPRWCVVGLVDGGRTGVAEVFADGRVGRRHELQPSAFVEFVRARQAEGTLRWVWSDTPTWLPKLLGAGLTVERGHDLRLAHAILRGSEFVHDASALVAAGEWDRAAAEPVVESGETLFDLDSTGRPEQSVPHELDAALAEFRRQRHALEGTDQGHSRRLELLLAAESAGALAAVEMRAAGLPWDAAEHDRILQEALGPRPSRDAKPARMLELAAQVGAALGARTGAHDLSIDSPPKLLRALQRAGIDVQSTSQWELADIDHPAIAPLLEYKKLARLLSANGWAWIEQWVRDGRYRPVYVPGGVVTGRWASSGGGALQIPRSLRPVIRADPGWTLVSADVAQLEPRVLAAMSQDSAMADAGRGADLYAGIVASGVVETRQEAKIAVLGAMYGGTTGDSGRLVPRLRRSFPSAMRLVDDAAAAGERGSVVSTWLGRSSPPPDPQWLEQQSLSRQIDASPAQEQAARRAAREFGRFTRNFIVQGSAAEWALAWIADLRLRLARLPETRASPPALRSGPVFSRRAHLVFYLHDEVMVHTPIEHADAAAAAVEQAAASAGSLLFGNAPVDFPLDIRIAEQ